MAIETLFIRTNVDQVLKNLDSIFHRQMPYAMSLALTRTVVDGQHGMRNSVRRWGMTLRAGTSENWMQKHVMIPPGARATKTRLRARLVLKRLRDKTSRSSLVPWLESGGVRAGVRQLGDGQLFPRAITIPVRPSATYVVPERLYPSNLGLSPRRAIAGGFEFVNRKKSRGRRRPVQTLDRRFSLRGIDRTFVVLNRAKGPGAGTILQRTGPGRGDFRPLYLVRPQIRVAGKHFFLKQAGALMTQRFPVNVQNALIDALRTAR